MTPESAFETYLSFVPSSYVLCSGLFSTSTLWLPQQITLGSIQIGFVQRQLALVPVLSHGHVVFCRRAVGERDAGKEAESSVQPGAWACLQISTSVLLRQYMEPHAALQSMYNISRNTSVC